MSLQLVANHLAQKGRGPDSTLVHMSNREVAGLNALAQKHGGQLSVNPETGLPEAGFLDSILPAVAGFGLSAVTGGAIDPMMAGAIVGGITALDSKDLSKGLVAGLGAYGGAGMAGGLGALGGATDPTNVASAQYGKGFDAFTKAPIDSLSTLGGGSALKGSLPILAGLAPAAADMMDSPDEEDTPPEQKKGYIRKYAFDPVTGQYKQVGAYEAGGDPNKDVTSEAGTAGSYGGVREPEYQQPKGMAEGGTASDSERIYDYLMGRGPNPMQFTHTSSPQVDYNVNKPNVPITPTTQILEAPFDQYGNIKQTGPGGYSPDERKAALEAKQDYLSVDGNKTSLSDYFNLSKTDREALDKRVAVVNPFRTAIKTGLETFGTPILFRAANAITGMFKGKSLNDVPRDEFGNVVNTSFSGPVFGGTPAPVAGPSATPYAGSQMGPGQSNGLRAQDVGPSNDSSNVNSDNNSNDSDSSGDADSGGYADSARFAGSSTDAQGGYLQHGQFDQRMARGGGVHGSLRPPQPFYEGGKFSYKGPQVYADGGIAALAQGYDDGGMTLPMKAKPIKNLGSMHPKSLQAAYDLAVATNDVAGTRKYQNELGLREKFKNPQIYADGGETGEYNLGSYSDGGRLLKGPGNGTSDNIPATIGHNQPARLADGEFVLPARIVSEIGNGSTDAGARELYKMMDRIQQGRAKTVGKNKVAFDAKTRNYLPA